MFCQRFPAFSVNCRPTRGVLHYMLVGLINAVHEPGHRVVLNVVHTVVANAAANFSVVWLGQLWSLILFVSALPPQSLYPTRTFRPGF